MFGALSISQFAQIKDDIAACRAKLVICDFNGVLDDYYQRKYDYLRHVLGDEYAQHLAALAVFTDTEYVRDQSANLESSIRRYFDDHKLDINPATETRIAIGAKRSQLTSDAREFLSQMTAVPFVVYTAQPQMVTDEYRNADPYVDWVSAYQLGNPKPSVHNLEELMRRYSVTANQVCVIGDGLIDDLMPAKLLGMHTILVSPFADMIVSNGTD